MPLLFIAYFLIAPEPIYLYLVLAALTALGLILPYRRHLFDAEQRRSRVRSSPEDPFPPGSVGVSRESAIYLPEDLRQLALDDPDAWLVASARYFQTLEFFMEYLDLPDDELPDAISDAVRWHWDGPLPPEEVARDLQLADMVLLLGDRRRVWWRDLEGVFAGEDAYVTTLTEWAAISRGAFAPTDIIEHWHSEDGPADIEFTLGGRRHRVSHPNVRDDFLNIGIISDINRLIGDSGYQFAVCDNLGMPNWVVALTREEQDRLRYERGWSFFTL